MKISNVPEKGRMGFMEEVIKKVSDKLVSMAEDPWGCRWVFFYEPSLPQEIINETIPDE